MSATSTIQPRSPPRRASSKPSSAGRQYPVGLDLFYPTTGNFLGFVGNPSSRADVRAAVGAFRAVAQLPSEGAVLPSFLPGVGWSDQWAFWQAGYPDVMITDTAPFRNPRYHTHLDLPRSMDFGRMTLAVEGLVEVVKGFAR